MVKVDETGDSVKFTDDLLVKIDGITSFRKVERNGKIYLQFCDHDRMRSTCRGSRFVEVELLALIMKLS